MRLTYKPSTGQGVGTPNLSCICPYCGHSVQLLAIGKDDAAGNNVGVGQRYCPREECYGHLFVITQYGKLVAAHPKIRLQFSTNGIPKKIVNVFNEALDCHASQCFVAAAIMVRRTLEELCEERGAKGANLKERIKNLASSVVLPPALVSAMDSIRLLGNDAAHIEASTFNKISTEELEAAIELTKEILKGIYQYNELLTRLEKLKKAPEDG